jgi:hypothetical protein
MNFLGRLLLVIFLALPAMAAEKITQATINGQYYSQIQDAHVVSGGRVVILFGDGGIASAVNGENFIRPNTLRP